MKELLITITILMMTTPKIYSQSDKQKFPKLTAEKLTREKITFPDDLKDDINILILVFEQQAQYLVDTWADIILPEFEPQAGISYHEVPMISTWWMPLSWQIDNWMRGGIPDQYHDNTATFYGDRGPYFSALEMPDKQSCYLFILNQSGDICFRTEGARNREKEEAFRRTIAELDGKAKL